MSYMNAFKLSNLIKNKSCRDFIYNMHMVTVGALIKSSVPLARYQSQECSHTFNLSFGPSYVAKCNQTKEHRIYIMYTYVSFEKHA